MKGEPINNLNNRSGGATERQRHVSIHTKVAEHVIRSMHSAECCFVRLFALVSDPTNEFFASLPERHCGYEKSCRLHTNYV